MGTYVPYGITPATSRGDVTTLRLAGTLFSDPTGMQGWVDLVGLVTCSGGIPTRRWRWFPANLSTNWTQYRVTLFKRQKMPPLCHAANYEGYPHREGRVINCRQKLKRRGNGKTEVWWHADVVICSITASFSGIPTFDICVCGCIMLLLNEILSVL